MLQLPCSSPTTPSFQVHRPWSPTPRLHSSAFGRTSSGLSGRQVTGRGGCSVPHWSFLGGTRVAAIKTEVQRPVSCKKPLNPAYCLLGSQIANHAFTWGTVAVLPFYTLMVIAPNAELTKRSMDNSIPYVILGILYAYLLFLSWTPDTIRLMFASKYWLPELSGMVKMFAREITMASAWIHLLAVDLFAARQIFNDGQKNNIETRHSVSFCLLFCPIGILVHVITKVLTRITSQRN